jgi:chromodomain-helicase-DNA-binding protein 4
VSEGSAEEDELEESESGLDEFAPPTRARKLRSATRLPFSPAKAPTKRRLRKRIDSDSGSEVQTARRSTRSTRTTRSYRDDDHEVGEEEESDAALPARKKKRARPKASRPAYGHVREVENLELDDQSDDETLPLRAHRDECEKCHHPPSHILLKKLDRKRKQRRSRDSDEEDSEDEDEDERNNFESLGGWVRW